MARPLSYAVFAHGDGRPDSRPAVVPVTALPPVSGLAADVGPAAVSLRWSAHPDAAVRVTRTGPGDAPVRLTGSGCQVSGLAEGQPQHFEVTAVYRGPDGGELRSVPEYITVTPRPHARPVSTLRANPVGADGAIRVLVTWVPVDNSEVKIVRAEREVTHPFGAVVSAEEMKSGRSRGNRHRHPAGEGRRFRDRTAAGSAPPGAVLDRRDRDRHRQGHDRRGNRPSAAPHRDTVRRLRHGVLGVAVQRASRGGELERRRRGRRQARRPRAVPVGWRLPRAAR